MIVVASILVSVIVVSFDVVVGSSIVDINSRTSSKIVKFLKVKSIRGKIVYSTQLLLFAST